MNPVRHFWYYTYVLESKKTESFLTGTTNNLKQRRPNGVKDRRRRCCAAVLIALLLGMVSGCGYTTRVYIGPYRTIYIEPFKNSINIASAKSEYANYVSYYPLLESTITKKVVERFIFDGNLKVVKAEDADVIIKGELTYYNRSALAYAQNNEDVTEYRLTLVVNLEFYNNKTQKAIWRQDGFEANTTYFTAGSLAISEKAALDNTVVELARRIVESVTEAW